MRLKNIHIFSVLLPVALLLSACKDELYNTDYTPSLESHLLSVSPRDFQFGNGVETKKGNVKSKDSWHFSDMPSWLAATPANGSSNAEFSITSEANTSLSSREAIFLIGSENSSGGGAQRVMTASQKAADAYINFKGVNSTTMEVDGKGDNLNISVESNLPDLTVASSQPWAVASYNPEALMLTIAISPNETDETRNCLIVLSSSAYNEEARLTISQLATDISISDGMMMEFDADGGTQSKSIQSDLPWTAKTSCTWLDFSPKSGDAGESTISISAQPSYETDERVGQIYFYFGDSEKKYISVSQRGRYIDIPKKSIEFSASGGEEEKIGVNANIEWRVSSCPQWIHLDKDQGYAGNSGITVSADRNNSMSSRSGTITICDSPTGNIEVQVNVTQNGLNIEDGAVLEFNWLPSEQILTVPFSDSWDAAVSDDWITLSEYSGMGETDIMVSVAKNESEDSRTGNIIIYSGGKRFDINVIQNGQYLRIESAAGEISAMGGKIELSVYSSVDMAVETDVDWIHVDFPGGDVVELSIDYNNSAIARTGIVRFRGCDEEIKTEYFQGIEYSVRQQGRSLTCNIPVIKFDMEGGESSIYSIEADGEYEIAKDNKDTWYILNHSKETNSFSITATPAQTTREGTVTIKLSGLPSGKETELKIPVIQNDVPIWVIVGGYGPDEIWN